MIEFVELHDVGNGMPIAIPLHPFAIACIEPVENECGKRIGAGCNACVEDLLEELKRIGK